MFCLNHPIDSVQNVHSSPLQSMIWNKSVMLVDPFHRFVYKCSEGSLPSLPGVWGVVWPVSDPFSKRDISFTLNSWYMSSPHIHTCFGIWWNPKVTDLLIIGGKRKLCFFPHHHNMVWGHALDQRAPPWPPMVTPEHPDKRPFNSSDAPFWANIGWAITM